MDKRILDKLGVTEEWIEQDALQYENGTFELSGDSSPICYGKPAILKRSEAEYGELGFENAAVDILAKCIQQSFEQGEAKEQRRVIQMLECSKVGLTLEQKEMLIKEITLATK